MNQLTAINKLNALDEEQAQTVFLQCCTSSAWVNQLASAIPYSDYEHLVNLANNVWQSLAEKDYLEAFEGHPKIGDVNSLRAKYANTKALASGEQGGVNHAPEDILQALSAGNNTYENKFGFIFIVCATGKSAAEMLSLLEERLPNDRHTELYNAAEEQRKIFHIRIIKMLESLND